MKPTISILAVCAAFAAAPVAAQEVTIKIADSLPADHIITRNTTDVFTARLKEELGDRIAIEHYPAQQLAKAKDILSITQAGIADIGYIVPSYVSEKMPLGGVVELPGEISSSCEGSLAFEKLIQPGGKLDQLEFQPNGVRVLYNVALSPYQAIFSKRADVTSLEGFKGMKTDTPWHTLRIGELKAHLCLAAGSEEAIDWVDWQTLTTIRTDSRSS